MGCGDRMSYLLLFIGFALLLKGADLFVKGSSNIAKLLRVPTILVGLTIVAFGTGSPEVAVSVLAAMEGTTELAIGNAVGSNIYNTAFIIGLTAFIYPLKVDNQFTKKEIPFAFIASIVLLVLMSDQNLITRGDGIIFLLFFGLYLYYIIEIGRKSRQESAPPSYANEASNKREWLMNISRLMAGLATIIIGGYLVVENSTKIAYTFGISETLTGLTIVAIGSSAPELIISIVAAMKKQSEMAIGNIVGSSIFNILFVLGVSSLVTPLQVTPKIYFDVLFMIVLTIVLFIFSRTHYEIGKFEGLALAVIYVGYLIYIIYRN